MDDKLMNEEKKKKWNSPIIFSISAKITENGGSPAQPEDYINSPSGSL